MASNPLPDDAPGIPKSLERLLRVDAPSSGPRTSAVPKSALLEKLNAFLPQMEAANQALESADASKLNSIPAPVAMAPSTADAGGNAPDRTDGGKDAGALAVEMDVYVDDKLGELVPNARAAEESSKVDAERGPPLVEEVPDKKQ